MDAEGLRHALNGLRWSRAELSRRLGVHRKTVEAWAAGRVAVPLYASAYIDLTIAQRGMRDALRELAERGN